MVSPHPEWEDRDNGLSKEKDPDDPFSEEVHITVLPVVAKYSNHGAAIQSVKRGSENAYSIIVETGTPGYGTHDDIIQFRGERSAWEFTHLLTHYFTHTTDPGMAKADLLHTDPMMPTDQWHPNRVIEDLDATEAFKKLLSPSPTPDGLSDVMK